MKVEDRVGGKSVDADRESLVIAPTGGAQLRLSEMRMISKPALRRMTGDAKAARLADRSDGWEARASFESADGNVKVDLRAVLGDDANYIRQHWTIRAQNRDLPAADVRLIDIDLPGARVAGTVEGSPIVAANFFVACEHPIARNRVEGDTAVCSVGTFSTATSRAILRAKLRDRRGRAGATAAVVPVLHRARAAAALRPVSALQLVVRHRLGRPQDERGAMPGGDRPVRPRAGGEARREA